MELDRKLLAQSGSPVTMLAILSHTKATTNALGMEKLRAIVAASPNIVHFEIDDIAQIDSTLTLLAKASPGILVINGGDGTVGAVLSSILHKEPFSIIPPIAILPGGKTNMTAADLGCKGSPDKVLSQFLMLSSRGEIEKALTMRHLIELDLGDGSSPKVGTFFGAAEIVKAINWTRKNAYSKGFSNSVSHVLTFVTFIATFLGLSNKEATESSNDLEISVSGGKNLKGAYSVVTATTLNRLVMGLKPYGSDGTGGLRFSAVQSGAFNVIRALGALLTGRWGKTPVEGLYLHCSNEIKIRSTEPVTLDGEIFFPSRDQQITLKGDQRLLFLHL